MFYFEVIMPEGATEQELLIWTDYGAVPQRILTLKAGYSTSIKLTLD